MTKQQKLYIYIYTHAATHHNFLGHLVCFPLLGYGKWWCDEYKVHISFQISVFILIGKMPQSGIDGLYDNSIFNFRGNFILFSMVATPIYIRINSIQVFPFSPSLILAISCLFDTSHSDKCGWFLAVVLIYISLMISDVEHLFMSVNLTHFFDAIQALCPFFY